MVQQNRYPADKYPPTSHLAAAIKRLPTPGPDVLPQTVEIDSGPGHGRFKVVFVARQNPALDAPAWFWGVESSEKIVTGQGGHPEAGDPEGGGGAD
jgi:hypothetical protein